MDENIDDIVYHLSCSMTWEGCLKVFDLFYVCLCFFSIILQYPFSLPKPYMNEQDN